MKESRHVLVPPHIKLSEDEKREIIEKYGPLHRFPKIKLSDPALKGLKVKVGDVIKIIRSEKEVYYRVVVEG